MSKRRKHLKAEKRAETVAGNPIYLLAYTVILFAVMWAIKLILG